MPGIVKSTKTTHRKKYYNYRRRRLVSKRVLLAASKYTMKQLRKQTETKHYDRNITSTSVTDLGSIWDLQSMAQGDSDNDREGDSITAMSYQLRYSITAGDTTNLIRLIMFQWRDVANFPAASQILQSYGSSLGVLSPYKHDTKPLFKILVDKICSVDTDDPSVTGKIYIGKGFFRKIQYNTPGGSTVNNGIYFLAISDSGAVTHPDIEFVSRCRYKDN